MYNHTLKHIKYPLYTYVDASICLQEYDVSWNISWPFAASGEVVKQKCPGGAESLGMHYKHLYVI